MKTLRKFLITFMLLAVALQATACGSKKEATQESVVKIQDAVLAADTSLPDMTTVNSDSEDAADLFAFLSDVDYSKINSFFLSYSSKGLADEIAVIRVKDSADVATVKKSIEEHIEGRVNFYKSYDETQVDRAEGALIFTNDRDVVLVVSDNQETVRSAYKKQVK